MQIAYAFRRSSFYPFQPPEASWDAAHNAGGQAWLLPNGHVRSRFLTKVKDIGFDGIELGVDSFGGMDAIESQAKELQQELSSYDLPCVAVRAGGGLCQPSEASHNRKRLEKAIEVAGWIGAGIVNSNLGSMSRNRKLDSMDIGIPVQHGSSQLATEQDFVQTSEILHEVGEMGKNLNVTITVEVHQHSIADNSWSTLKLLEMTNSSNVFVNPDLANILWHYDEPEETTEDAIVSLAPVSRYWHCKNLQRAHIPENERAVFIRVPLPDGEVDYRFAISAMLESSYDGYLAIEGAVAGDQLYADQRSLEYVRSILDEPR